MAIAWNNIRFCNRVDTLDNWMNSDKGLLNGELGIVIDSDTDSISMIVGDGKTTVEEILSNSGDDYYDKFRLFTGDWSRLAQPYNAGLVKTGNKTQTGLVVNNGTISLSSEVWEKLNKEQENEIDSNVIGDNIILRSNATTVLESTSGIYIKKIDNIAEEGEDPRYIDGFFGYDNNALIYAKVVSDSNEYSEYYYIPLISNIPQFNKKQMIVGKENGIISFDNPNTLQFIVDSSSEDDKGIVSYNCSADVTVDISPYHITLNGDPFAYDKTTRSYNLQYSGGISEENQIRLQKVEQLYADVDNLKTISHIIKQGDGVVIVESTENNNKVQTISVAEVDKSETTNTGLTLSSGSTFKCITGISTNEHGQVTSVTYTQYKIA